MNLLEHIFTLMDQNKFKNINIIGDTTIKDDLMKFDKSICNLENLSVTKSEILV